MLSITPGIDTSEIAASGTDTYTGTIGRSGIIYGSMVVPAINAPIARDFSTNRLSKIDLQCSSMSVLILYC